MYIDGIELQYCNLIGDGMLQVILVVGNSKVDFFNVDLELVLEYDFVFNSFVIYEIDYWLFKGIVSYFCGEGVCIDGFD